MSEERCPNCGALVSEGADWCGLCFAPLSLAAQQSHASTTGGDAAGGESDPGASLTIAVGDAPTEELRIEVEEAEGDVPASDDPFSPEAGRAAGAVGDTEPHAGLDPTMTVWNCPVCEHENPIELSVCEVCGTPFARLFGDDHQPRLDPDEAAKLALIPGMAHMRMNQPAEGLSRLVTFFGSLAVVVLFLFTGSGAPRIALVALFTMICVLCVVESVYDARRLAQGDRQVIEGRWLVYGFGVLFVLAVVIVVATSLKVTPQSVPDQSSDDVPGPEVSVPLPSPIEESPSPIPSPSPSLSLSPTTSPSLVPGAFPEATPSTSPGIIDPNASPSPATI